MDKLFNHLKNYTKNKVTDKKLVDYGQFKHSHFDLIPGKRYLVVTWDEDVMERLDFVGKFVDYTPAYPGAYGDLGEGYSFHNDDSQYFETVLEDDNEFFELIDEFKFEDIYTFLKDNYSYIFCDNRLNEDIDTSSHNLFFMYKNKQRLICTYDNDSYNFCDITERPDDSKKLGKSLDCNEYLITCTFKSKQEKQT